MLNNQQVMTPAETCAESLANGMSCNSTIMQLACKRTCNLCPNNPQLPGFERSPSWNGDVTSTSKGVCAYSVAAHVMYFLPGSRVSLCDEGAHECYCALAPPSPPPLPASPPATPGKAYEVYGFTVTENYATTSTIFDADAQNDRFNTYRTVLEAELRKITTSTTTDVQIRVSTPVRPLNGSVAGGIFIPPTSSATAVAARSLALRKPIYRRRAQSAAATTCAQQYTPVEISVTLAMPQSTEWVEQVVEQAGYAALNSLEEEVVQCDDIPITIDAPLQLVDAKSPPPPSPPPPPPRPQSPPRYAPDWRILWWSLLGAVAFLGLMCTICVALARGSDDDDWGEKPRLGVLGVGQRVGSEVSRALGHHAGKVQGKHGKRYLGLKLEQKDLQ